MRCVRPKRIINPRYRNMDAESLHRLSERLYGVGFPPNYYIEVPCGACLLCDKNKFKGYRFRLLYELKRYPNSIFVTLTFDNSSLSRFKDNPNKSLSLFLDRIRKKYGKQVRHWFVAEFGEKNGRLHYHGILFNINISNDNLSSLWKYGNTFVGYANEATAVYIVKYLTKQDTKGKFPPRIVSSKGIGDSWLDTPEANFCKKSLCPLIKVNGLPFVLPRYYIDKLFSSFEKEKISYYYYMETPLQDEFFYAGRSYNLSQYRDIMANLLKDYKARGFLYDDYKRRKSISFETRSKVLFDIASKCEIEHQFCSFSSLIISSNITF